MPRPSPRAHYPLQAAPAARRTNSPACRRSSTEECRPPRTAWRAGLIPLSRFSLAFTSVRMRAAAQICLDDLRVRADLQIGAHGNLRPVIDCDHPMRQPFNQSHIVLDQQDAAAALMNGDDVGHDL